MDRQRKRVSWVAVLIGVVVLGVVLVVLFATTLFSLIAPLQVGSGLPGCESDVVEQGVADFITAQNPGADISIVSVQEISRQQATDGGPVERRDCQVNLRTEAGYERVILELTADGGPDATAWHLRMGQLTDPPVAAPIESAPSPVPPREESPPPAGQR